MAGVAASIGPADDIDWLLVKDIVDYTWQINRCRRLSVGLINSSISSELDHALRLLEVPESTTYVTTVSYDFQPETVECEITEEELKRSQEERDMLVQERQDNPYLANGTRDYNAIYAKGFIKHIEKIRELDALIEWAERRRNAALKNLEQRRKVQPRSPRSPIIDGDL